MAEEPLRLVGRAVAAAHQALAGLRGPVLGQVFQRIADTVSEHSDITPADRYHSK